MVALRKESVDRNRQGRNSQNVNRVALRKESVDRNFKSEETEKWHRVALRKESVDRNRAMQVVVIIVRGRSPQGERG